MKHRVHTAIKSEIEEHFIDYLILMTGTVLFLMILSFFQGQRWASYYTITGFTAFYLLWGILHHIREDTAHLKNVLEYILISFGVLLLITIVFSF